MDEGDEAGQVDFFAPISDVDIDDVAGGGGIHGVEVFPDFAAGHELAAFEGEKFEEGIFARGEGDGFSAAADGAAGGVDFEIEHPHDGIFDVVFSADEGADAGFQFADDEGLADVIISAGIESADAVFGIVVAGEDKDVGGDAFGAHFSEEVEAVGVGEADVEDDDVVFSGEGEAVSGSAVVGGIDGETGAGEDGGDQTLDGIIIFNEQERHGAAEKERGIFKQS